MEKHVAVSGTARGHGVPALVMYVTLDSTLAKTRQVCDRGCLAPGNLASHLQVLLMLTTRLSSHLRPRVGL